MRIKEIIYACEILGINKNIKDQDSEEIICQKLADRHHSKISKDAVLKKIANFERTLVSKPNDATLLEKKQVCENILQALENGNLMSQIDAKELNDYQDEIRAEFLVLKFMEENRDCTIRQLLYKISLEFFNVFSMEELEIIVQKKKRTSRENSSVVFSSEFLDMIRTLNHTKYAQSYQLLREALKEKLGKSFYEPQMFEQLKEALAVVVKDNAMQRGKNAINPTEEAANYLSRQIIPYCETSEEMKVLNKRDAALILLEVPDFVTYFARTDRNMEIVLDLSKTDTAETIFAIIGNHIGSSAEKVERLALKIAPFLNLVLKEKENTKDNGNMQDLSIIRQYIFQNADKFYNEIDDRLIAIQGEIYQKNGDHEKAEMLYQNIGIRFQSWKVQHEAMKQYETMEVCSEIPVFSEKMKQDEEHIRVIAQRIGEYQGWMNDYAALKKGEINRTIAIYNTVESKINDTKKRYEEFLRDYTAASEKGKIRSERELQILYAELDQIDFGKYIAILQEMVNKYPKSSEIKTVWKKSGEQRKEIVKISNELKKMEADLQEVKAKRKRRKIIYSILLIVAAVFLLDAGFILKQRHKIRTYAKNFTVEDLASLKHYKDDKWFMERYDESADYGNLYKIEDLCVGKIDQDGHVPIQYRIDDGIVNAVYYEEIALDMRVGFYLIYDHCEIQGIDIIGTWEGPWDWQDGMTVAIDYYEDETGKMSGTYRSGFEGDVFQGTLNKTTGTWMFGSKHKLVYNPQDRGFELIEGDWGREGSVLSKVQ